MTCFVVPHRDMENEDSFPTPDHGRCSLEFKFLGESGGESGSEDRGGRKKNKLGVNGKPGRERGATHWEIFQA